MITPMSRIELVCLSGSREKVVEVLQGRAILHLEEVPLETESVPDFLRRARLEGEEHDTLVRFEELERTVNEITPLVANAPDAAAILAAGRTVEDWDETHWKTSVDEFATRLREMTRKKVDLQDTLSVLQNYHTILEQVTPALGGAQVTLGKGTRALVLTGDVMRAVERLEERFREEVGPECHLHHQRTSRKNLVGLVTFPEDMDEAVGRVLHQEGIAPVDLRDESYEGATVGEVIGRIEKTMENRRASLEEVQREINDYGDAVGAELAALKTLLSDRLSQLRAQQQFAQSEMTTVIHGWTPRDRFDELEVTLEREFSGQAVINRITQEGIEHTHVPTLLRNHKIFQPFEMILSLFRPPTYGTIDPTVMVAVSFILFYGFILGDVAYGFGVLAAAMFLRKKFGHIDMVKSASTIGVYMAVSSIIFGVLYGEYLGNVGADVFGLRPIWFHRGHEQITLLVYALYIGIAHMLLSLVLGIREDFRHHHTDHGIERLGMLFGLLALIMFAFGFFDVAPFSASFFGYLEAALLIVGIGLIFKAMGAMGLMGVLEIMSLGGNVISYARLMALGIAGIAIADIANDLPEQLGIWIGVPMAFAVHLFNIGLGIASPTIHSLRLNFVEFLPKFYNPEGKNFTPFRKETQW